MPYFSHLEQPVSAEAPCGIDLDADPDLQTFLTMAESSLPERFSEFDRKAFDDKTYIDKIDGFLKKSRDIRLLVFAIKTFALTDNLPGFFEGLAATANLLAQNWADAFPRPAEGDYTLRSAYIQSLDERATMLFPLQNSTLIKDKRLGNITYRAFMLAQKPALAKAGEPAHDAATLEDALTRFEPLDDLVVLHGQFKAAAEHLKKLRELFIEHAGYEAAPKFELLSAFLGEVEAVLAKTLTDRAPPETIPEAQEDASSEGGVLAEGTAAATGTATATGDLKSVKEASHALKAIVAYYAAYEPSSPAKLLIRQAQQLVGKSFVEAMQVLAPGLVKETKIDITGTTPFSLSFEQLLALAAGDGENVGDTGESREFTVKTRAEASDLMKSVENFYRKFEPSSPIPLLIDRARRFVSKDFATLLAEMSKNPVQP
jgi:type VI secretion system protein ImpA